MSSTSVVSSHARACLLSYYHAELPVVCKLSAHFPPRNYLVAAVRRLCQSRRNMGAEQSTPEPAPEPTWKEKTMAMANDMAEKVRS